MLSLCPSSLVAISALLLCAHAQEEADGPPELFANVGDSVVFDCQLEFPNDIPIPYIVHWNKGGETVFSFSNGELSTNEQYQGRVSPVGEEPGGAVNLTSIREADNGWYECRIYFPNRTPSTRLNGTWFHLTVDAGSLIATPPINVTKMEGESAHFSCITKPQPKDVDVKVTWYKDGAPLDNLDDLKARSFVVDEGSLTIAPTAMEDPGEYTCEVTAGAHRQQASAFLDVRYKAKVTYSPREVNLPLGRPGSLDCHYRANPPLTSLRWEKDGFLFDPYNVQGVFYRRNGSLFFDRVDETHQGKYTCTPFNDLGTEGPSPMMDVRVQRPPVFTSTPHNMYLLRSGDAVELPCEADDGSPDSKPTIVWFKKDGTALPRGRYHLSGGNLTIAEVREEDRGVYQCVASNGAGTISAETTLALENQAPRPPFNLRALSASTSVTLRWQSGSERPPKTYSIWYRRADSPEWRTLLVEDPDQTEAVVSNLRAGREYEFMVLSQDERGDGMFSKPIHVMTTGGFQHTGPPANLSANAEQGGLLLSWDPPAVSGDLVTHYVVRWWKKSADGEKLLGDVQTEDTRILLRALDDGALYWIQVIAVAGVGEQRTMNPAPRLAVLLAAPKATKAVSFGVGAVVIVLIVLAGAAYWARSRFRRRSAGSASPADGSAASTDGKTVLA